MQFYNVKDGVFQICFLKLLQFQINSNNIIFFVIIHTN